MDFLKTWNDYKSLLAIAKNDDEDAVRNFLDQTRLPTENLTNSDSLSSLFALALNFKNFEALEILLRHGVRAVANQETGNCTVLQYAVISGNVKLISEMIEYGADCNIMDKDGNTLLHLAFMSSTHDWNSVEDFDNALHRNEAEKLIIDICDFLVDSGLGINVKNQRGETPLSLAIKYRNVKLTDYLVKRNADLNIFGKSLSHHLVQDEIQSSDQSDDVANYKNQRNLDFMDWWFSKKLDLDRKCSGMTPLQLCVRQVLKDVLLILINYTDKFDYLDANGENLLHTLFNSVLHLSKKDRNKNYDDRCVEIVKVLMDKGVSVNHTDKNGVTPFHVAAKLDNPKSMHMMLKNFTSVNACDSAKQTPLHFVVKHCNDKYSDQYLMIVSSLVTKGAEMDKLDRPGMSPLHHACENNTKASKAIIEFFADQGCNLNVANGRGIIPLHLCVNKDRVALLETLIKHGADVNLQYLDKKIKTTALHKATEEQLPDVMELLIKAGANPDEKDGAGNTALHVELDIGSIRSTVVLDKLLELGADVDVRDKANWSPLRKALYKGKYLCVRRLLKFGATVTDIDRSMLPVNFRIDFGEVTGQPTGKGCIVLHLVSLKAAGFTVPADYDRIVRPIQENLEALNEVRLQELEILKSTRIDDVVVYDFLHMSLKLRYLYAKKTNLKKYLEDYKSLEKSFPCYCDIISAKYWTAVHRMPLLDAAKSAWYRMTDVYLPEIYVEGILSYLQNWELRLVIKAAVE